MVAANFAWSGIPSSRLSPTGDPRRLSEILPTLLEHYGLESRAMERRSDIGEAARANGAAASEVALSRERTAGSGSQRVDRTAA
ncbi:MAG: hypothetical protein C0483_05165 [Pirellula sp.]|nr:hypothetical protein [Pirellula sp.]